MPTEEGIVVPVGVDKKTGKQRGVRKGYVSLAVQTGTNDNPAMADAVAALPTDGGVIELGKGTHYLDNFLAANGSSVNGIKLKGVGASPTGSTGTVIKPSSAASGNPVIYASGSFRTPALEDLTIDCTGSSTNPCFKLLGSAGTSGLAAAATRCWFINSTAMSAVSGRFGALTEVDGSASWGEIIAQFTDCGWSHGGINTSNMYLRTTNMHLMFLNRKMLMGYGGKNLDLEASGWIKDIHPYRACNGPSESYSRTSDRTIVGNLVAATRVLTVTSGTLTPEDTGRNITGTGLSGSDVYITAVTDSTHAKVSSAASNQTGVTYTINRQEKNVATQGLTDYHFRGTHGTVDIEGGDDEGIQNTIIYEAGAGQYGGIINLRGGIHQGRFTIKGGLCYLNIEGTDLYSGFINSEGGTLRVNADPVSIGGYNGSSVGPGAYNVISGKVEKPVMCSRRAGSVVFTKLNALIQDFDLGGSTSTLRNVLHSDVQIVNTLDSSLTAPTNPVSGAVHSDIHYQDDVIYYRGGRGDTADIEQSFVGTGMRRASADGWREHCHSQDSVFTPGSPFQLGDRFLGAMDVRDYLYARSTIELGHASDTTLSRSSAGNMAIEGNVVYRAGGTDVPITDGGTGQSTANAGFNALAPSQTGNSGKYLTTNGTDTSWANAPTPSNVSDGDKGDISVSSGTWTIDNNVVTYAKMQDVSATSRILGRITSGAGDAEELTGSNVRTITGLATTDSPTFAGVSSNSGPFGFVTGAGGYIAQGTNRNTDVTLDKVCGQILTTNDSLSNGSSAEFKLYNSYITAGTKVVLYIQHDLQSDLTTTTDTIIRQITTIRTETDTPRGYTKIWYKNESGSADTNYHRIWFHVVPVVNS